MILCMILSFSFSMCFKLIITSLIKNKFLIISLTVYFGNYFLSFPTFQCEMYTISVIMTIRLLHSWEVQIDDEAPHLIGTRSISVGTPAGAAPRWSFGESEESVSFAMQTLVYGQWQVNERVTSSNLQVLRY